MDYSKKAIYQYIANWRFFKVSDYDIEETFRMLARQEIITKENSEFALAALKRKDEISKEAFV